MWMSDVEMKVWIRGRCEPLIAFHAASMSALWVRASPQMTGPSTSRAIASTASKSPGEVIGNPASITSTPSRASCWAISTFSPVFSEMPGDCSPSRRVVSKMWTRFASPASFAHAYLLFSSAFDDLSVSSRLPPPSAIPPEGGGEGEARGC